MNPAAPRPSAQSRQRPTRVRHVVLWLTVAAYMITYMDRVVMSAALPVIRDEFGFSLATGGLILSAFRWGYAIFQIPGGWFGDKIGPRRALTTIVIWWSIFTCATAAAWGSFSMTVIRFFFGVGEAGAFPIATRSLSRWILPVERGFAQGVTHAGSRLGAALTPALVTWIIVGYGWRYAFVSFGVLGTLWAAVWFWYYRDTPAEHASVNDAERELIAAAIGPKPRKAQISLRSILKSRDVWILSLMYACYSYGLAVYLDWFPTYLREHRHFDLVKMGIFASLPLLAGVAGDLLGGWVSDIWAKRSGNLNLARRGVAIFGFLLAAVAIIPANLTDNPYTSVAFTCVAFFAIEVTVGVSWAIPLDIGGDAAMVSAVMNTAGNSAGACAPLVLPILVSHYGWGMPFFVAAGLCVVGAILFSRIDATRKVVPE